MSLKILFPLFINSSKGGMQNVVFDLIEGLNTNGYECEILTFKSSEIIQECRLRNINCHAIASRPMLLLLFFLIQYYYFIFSNNFKIIITNDIYSHILLSLYPLKKNEIFVSHGGDYKTKDRKHASNSGISALIAKYFSFKRISRFIAVSSTQRYNLITNAFIPSEKVSIIENGVYPIPINKSKRESDKIRISIVGYIKPLKNQEIAIQTLFELKNRGINAELNIYGSVQDNDYYQKIIHIIQKLQLCENIKFRGYEKNKTYIYENTDILMSCSHHEGFGLTIIEAMASKVPVIAYKGAEGPSSIIDNRRTGLLIEENCANSFADGICEYINDQDLKDSICENAFHLYESKYSEKKMVENYIKIINICNK